MQYQIKAVVQLCLTWVLLMGAVAMADPLTLTAAVDEAQASNPGLAAIQARAQAVAEIPSQAAALPDPLLSVNVSGLPLDSFSFTQEAMTQWQIGITQALPYPGKLALRSQAAAHDADAAGSAFDEGRLQLIRDVKTVWWNLFYLDRALDTVARNLVLLKQFVDIAETRYQVGKGLQQDILLAQLELSKLRDSAIGLHNMRVNEAARLNVLLGRSLDQMIQIPAVVSEALPSLFDESVLLAHSEVRRPGMAAQRQRMAAARSRVALAEKDHAPDFTLGAIYAARQGENADGSRRADLGSVNFSMNLPFYSGRKQSRAVDQRNAEWLQQKYQLDEIHNQVAAEIMTARNDYRQASEQVVLFKREIIPLAHQTVDAMLAGYQSGKIDFLDLIGSQTTLYNYETQYWKAISRANQALSRLEAAVGEENIYE